VFKLIGVHCLAALGRDLELGIYPVKCVVLFNKGEFEIWNLGFEIWNLGFEIWNLRFEIFFGFWIFLSICFDKYNLTLSY